ncbi:MAG: hypothetical protein K0U38_00945 [Epsilonproteobacteria bacterium]|nr:hypothetical protein [Campylobacterota bacterium]
MIKSIIATLLILLSVGCSNKSESIAQVTTTNTPVTVQEISEPKVIPTPVPQIIEPTAIKNIAANVPASCFSWSDGCNTCTRIGKEKASCTTYSCIEKGVFSCLKWQ